MCRCLTETVWRYCCNRGKAALLYPTRTNTSQGETLHLSNTLTVCQALQVVDSKSATADQQHVNAEVKVTCPPTSCLNLISSTCQVPGVRVHVLIECLLLSSHWLQSGSDWSVDFQYAMYWNSAVARDEWDSEKRFGYSARAMPLRWAGGLHMPPVSEGKLNSN